MYLIHEVSTQRLLELYWSTKNRAALALREPTKPEQKLIQHCKAEMLLRVDQGKMPADALPPSVYQAWCKIIEQPRPQNWAHECGNGCAWVAPYGWVPEDGCPVHDSDVCQYCGKDKPCNCWRCNTIVEPVQTKSPFTAEAKAALEQELRECFAEHGRVRFGHTKLHQGQKPKLDPVSKLREYATQAQRDVAEAEAEPRCGVVLLLAKLAAVVQDWGRVSPEHKSWASELHRKAIQASEEIFKRPDCFGIGCEVCARWEPEGDLE